MDIPDIRLRPAVDQDSIFAYELKKMTLGPYVAQTYGGWDDQEQWRLHERRFRPAETAIISDGHRDIGLLAVDRHEDHIRLRQLFLLPQAQGRGIGAKILMDLISQSREEGLPIRLQVLKTNPRAEAFYERYGFVLVGETQTHHQMEYVP